MVYKEDIQVGDLISSKDTNYIWVITEITDIGVKFKSIYWGGFYENDFMPFHEINHTGKYGLDDRWFKTTLSDFKKSINDKKKLEYDKYIESIKKLDSFEDYVENNNIYSRINDIYFENNIINNHETDEYFI